MTKLSMNKMLILNAIKLTVVFLGIYQVSLAQEKYSFEINGKIIGIPDKSEILLIQDLDTVGKARSNDEYFQLTGVVKGSANYYFLKIPAVKGDVFSEALWLENKKMRVESSISKWPNIKLTGSQSQLEYLEVKKLLSEAKDREEKMAICKDFIKNHRNSLYVSNLILRLVPQLKNEETKRIYNALTDRAKESFYGRELKAELDFRDKNSVFFENGMIGATIPNFRIRSVNGGIQFIHDLVKGNKYTLIDFWASWCVPCRAAIPRLSEAYTNFNAKGFAILGISLDRSEEDWLSAVRADNTAWAHYIDNVDNASETIFGILAVPGYMLVDSSGRILRTDIASKLNQTGNTANGKKLGTDLNEIIENLF